MTFWLSFLNRTTGSRRARGQQLRQPMRTHSLVEQLQDATPQQTANLSLAVSSLSLGMVATSWMVGSASVLGVVSLPLSLIVFVPTVRNAIKTIHEDRRIDASVLTMTRLCVYVAMSYYHVAAVDAFLFALAQKLHIQSRSDWERDIESLLENPTLIAALRDAQGKEIDGSILRKALEAAVAQETTTLQQAETSADRMAPFMLASFFATIPLLGINRAGAFLMTSFGAHMRTLNPVTVRDFVNRAAQQGVFVQDVRALETASRCDMLVLDLTHLQQGDKEYLTTALNTMRPLVRTIYLLTDDGATVDCPDGVEVLAVQSSAEKSAKLHGWQRDGSRICLVGARDEPSDLVQLYVAVSSGIGDQHVQAVIRDLASLPFLFENAAIFNEKQKFNYQVPIGFDIVDITTTIVIHFGLFYSALFNYSGLLLSTLNARRSIGHLKRKRMSGRVGESDVTAPSPSAMSTTNDVMP